jgi:uncharacterized membrane protein YqiK
MSSKTDNSCNRKPTYSLVLALRSVAARMTMEHLHANRADFVQKVQAALMTDLDMNGFQFTSVSITQFDQTAFKHFNENNAFDGEGLTVLTRTIEERKKVRNAGGADAGTDARRTARRTGDGHRDRRGGSHHALCH